MAAAWIAAPLTHKVIDAAERAGVDPAPLRAALGDSDVIDAETHYRIWHAVMESASRAFPMDYARCARVDDYDALGLACKTAADLRGALHRVSRYLALWTNTLDVSTRSSVASMQVFFRRPGRRNLGMIGAIEATSAEVLKAARDITGVRIVPARVFFRHPGPETIEPLRDFFGTDVEFEQAEDGFELEAATLQLPLSLADEGLSGFILGELDRRSRSKGESLESEVRAAIERLLPEGVPKMAVVAQQLRRSPRTLQRQLREADTSFSVLLQQTRRELAEYYLGLPEPGLAELGFLLGFSEPSAFHRAFKRWTSTTPKAFRAANCPAGKC